MAVPLKDQGMRLRVAAKGAESNTSCSNPCHFGPAGSTGAVCVGRSCHFSWAAVWVKLQHTGQWALGLGISEEQVDAGAGQPGHTGFKLCQNHKFEALKIISYYLSHCHSSSAQNGRLQSLIKTSKVVCALSQLPKGGGVFSRTCRHNGRNAPVSQRPRLPHEA